ncbi:MAG: glucose-1-phosphate thymidylyltransferase RfbA, partial [Pseudobdellovibrionaceae bacterium]
YPMTRVMTKQLQSIYDKPMIYYPLSILMLGGIKDILLITTPDDQSSFKKILGDGSQFGINISYKIQEKPNGLPEAFILGEEFIGNESVCLILGDNLFYGDLEFFRRAIKEQEAFSEGYLSRIFAYYVADASAYGVVEFDKTSLKIKSIEEKPKEPKSNYAIPGLYLFDSSVVLRAKGLKPSPRGETEIVDLIKSYYNEGKLGLKMMYRGLAWLDTGTPRNLLDASAFIGAIEERQGMKVACLEEVAYRMKFINLEQLKKITLELPKCSYRAYLEKIISEEV